MRTDWGRRTRNLKISAILSLMISAHPCGRLPALLK